MSEFWDMVESGFLHEHSGELLGGFGRRPRPPGGWKKRWQRQTPDKVECKICTGRWYTPQGLAYHNLVEHPELPIPEGYERCPDCGHGIPRNRMRKHRRKMHGRPGT
jgi:hypothetical protein